MNIKVVVAWVIAIILCAGLGIFGYVNRDLLEMDYSTYTPSGTSNSEKHECRASFDTGESIYTFQIVDDAIESMAITYKANGTDVDGYTSASNINTSITTNKLTGLASSFHGGTGDYSIMVTVKTSNYDKDAVEAMTEDYTRLYMVIDSITDYELYKEALANVAEYTCE